MYTAYRCRSGVCLGGDPFHRPGRKARGDLTALSCAQGQYPIVHNDGFLAEHAERYILVWDEVRRTLQLGFYIKDPTRGLTLP